MRILFGIILIIYWFGSDLYEVHKNVALDIHPDTDSNDSLNNLRNHMDKKNTLQDFKDFPEQFYSRRLLIYSKLNSHRQRRCKRHLNGKTPDASDYEEPVAEVNENRFEVWDDWGKWSTCSVTCGAGRKVRWRHCSAETCVKGLKKVQIKSCQAQNCSSKGFLNWLGIKT